MHKWLVAGLSRLVTCLQSNFIGTNFTGFCSNLGVRGLFSSPFGSYWVHIHWLAPGYLMGAGNPTISWETETQVWATCQPQQPHTIMRMLVVQMKKTKKKEEEEERRRRRRMRRRRGRGRGRRRRGRGRRGRRRQRGRKKEKKRKKKGCMRKFLKLRSSFKWGRN